VAEDRCTSLVRISVQERELKYCQGSSSVEGFCYKNIIMHAYSTLSKSDSNSNSNLELHLEVQLLYFYTVFKDVVSLEALNFLL